MKVIIETDRLLLREFTLEDGPLLYQLNLDPDVIKYTMDPIRDVNHAGEILEQVILPQYALYNHGRWAVLEKSSLQFIGWCGLKARPERGEIDLGYRFAKAYWGKGYATESAYASVKYGFQKLSLPAIIGRILPGNTASGHVLEKCGMRFVREEMVDGHLHKTYIIESDLAM